MPYTFRGIELPNHLKDSLDAYISTGRPTGGFLEACISNNLSLAVSRADEDCMRAIPAVVGYLYNEAPRNCWGSLEIARAWLEQKRAERAVSR